MKYHSNLVIGWSWLLLGFLSGMIQGFFFNREEWLGGYASFRRRMYRLAHISFFGLGIVNLSYAMTAYAFPLEFGSGSIASQAFIVGAISMPVACVTLAHFPKAKPLFSVPVLSLMTGAVLVLLKLIKL